MTLIVRRIIQKNFESVFKIICTQNVKKVYQIMPMLIDVISTCKYRWNCVFEIDKRNDVLTWWCTRMYFVCIFVKNIVVSCQILTKVLYWPGRTWFVGLNNIWKTQLYRVRWRTFIARTTRYLSGLFKTFFCKCS